MTTAIGALALYDAISLVEAELAAAMSIEAFAVPAEPLLRVHALIPIQVPSRQRQIFALCFRVVN